MSRSRPLFLVALLAAIAALLAFQADLDVREKPEPTTTARPLVPEAGEVGREGRSRDHSMTTTARSLVPEAGAASSRTVAAAETTPGIIVESFVAGLDTPWDLAWGPDGRIWVSERFGRISRVDPADGSVEVAGELEEVFENGESGLMGLAFHPDFDAQPYVYAAHTYRGPRGLRNRLVRMRWDGERLGDPQALLDDIPGAGNHDGSRLAVGPDGFLYMTTGDASAQRHPHDLDSPAGKILRLTLEGGPAPGNPFGSIVYSFGHRNPQGLAFHAGTGFLYATEHGPDRADEVNRIVAGGDYGWPEVRGACDAGGDEARYCSEHDVVEPLWEWTPTVGISGLAIYEDGPIADWRNSLLATSLRGGTLFRLPLPGDGTRVGEPEAVFGGVGRLRDVLVAPDGTVYVATSNRDGRGRPAEDDDRILVIRPDAPSR